MQSSSSNESFEIKFYDEINNISSLIDYCNVNNSFKQTISVVDASNIINIFHLQVVIHQAIARKRQHHMKSKSFYDEIMLCLCGSNRISKAHSMFHVHSNTKRIAIITIKSTNISDSNSMFEVSSPLLHVIRSIGVEMSSEAYRAESKSSSDLERISKVFDLSVSEISGSGIEKAIITRVAISDV